MQNWNKTGTNFMYLSQFDKFFFSCILFMSFLMHVSAQIFQSEHFECAKEFAFKKSALDQYMFTEDHHIATLPSKYYTKPSYG